jgi:hypothetical protein
MKAVNGGCIVKELPANKALQAAKIAVEENPANAPRMSLPDPMHVAVLTGKYWGAAGAADLPTAFMESTPTDLKERILSHLNAWGLDGKANVRFRLTDQVGSAVIRITRSGGGYWSYLGTDNKLIPKGQATMSLQAFTMETPESEYRRVVRHEAGHALGMPHEHMRRVIVSRLDENKTIAYFQRYQGWTAAQTRQQVLTPIEETALYKPTPADETSIMAYQLPETITKDGKPILGGLDINEMDAEYVAKIYQGQEEPPPTPDQIKLVVKRMSNGHKWIGLIVGVGQINAYLNPSNGVVEGSWNRKGFLVTSTRRKK